MIVESLYKTIYRGKSGLNIGLSTGLPKMDSITYGVQQGWMTVIGGDSGSGKSTLTLYTAVYRPFMEYIQSGKAIDIHWLIFSFEMSSEVLFAKLLSLYLYEAYHEIISYSEILSFTEQISDDKYNLILEAKDWLDELEAHCTIVDQPVTAKGLFAIAKEWSRNFGAYEKIDEHTENYIPKNPRQYLITVVDHIALLQPSPGATNKQEIDEATKMLIYFRNKCHFTVYVVQQLNRNFKSMARRTEGGGAYVGIQLDDFSDSSGTTNGAEVVIAIFHPAREKMGTCNDYKINKGLGDRARILSVLKHRFGQSDVSIGTCFYGEIGLWKELPKGKDMKDEDYDKFLNL